MNIKETIIPVTVLCLAGLLATVLCVGMMRLSSADLSDTQADTATVDAAAPAENVVVLSATAYDELQQEVERLMVRNVELTFNLAVDEVFLEARCGR